MFSTPNAGLLSSSLVLLGSAIGDDSTSGIDNRPLAQVRSDERTTAAGRFVSEHGRDETGERVIWIDYAAALAIHRVKVIDPKERRFERIATDSITDKRISNGCINVPIAFLDAVVEPTLGRSRAVVYVLPVVKPLRQVFPTVVVVAVDFPAGERTPLRVPPGVAEVDFAGHRYAKLLAANCQLTKCPRNASTNFGRWLR